VNCSVTSDLEIETNDLHDHCRQVLNLLSKHASTMFGEADKKNIEGIGLFMMLVLGVLSIGFVNSQFGLQSASAAETITASKTTFFGSNVVEITFTDDNLEDNNDAGEEDEVTVSFEVFSGGDTALDDVTIGDDAGDVSAEIGDTGKFIFYLTADADVVIGDLDDPEFGADSQLVFLGEGGDVDVGTDAGNSAFDGLTDGISLNEGATIEITQGDATVTITYQDDKADIVLDRTGVGSAGFVYLTINDQDANNDPTDRDALDFDGTEGNLTKTYTGVVDDNLGQAIVDAGIDLQETSDNSGIFEARLSIDDVFDIQADDTPKSVKIELQDFEVFPNDPFYDADEAGVPGNDDTDVSLSVDNSDGMLQEVTNPASPSSELKIVISDADRNLDSKVKDRIIDAIAADLSSGSTDDSEAINDVTANVLDLTETGVNTGLFVPDVANNLIEVTIRDAVPNNGRVEIDSDESARSDLLVRYGDLSPDDANDLDTDLDDDVGDVNEAKTILFKGKAAANLPAIISLAQTQVGAQDKVFVVITDMDMNDDKESVDSFDLTIPELSFDEGVISVTSITFNSVDIADLMLESRINGEEAGADNPLSNITLSFQETGDNTGIFSAEFEYEFLAAVSETADGDNTEFTWFDQLLDSPLESSTRLTINEADKRLQWQQNEYAVPFVQDGRGTDSLGDGLDGKRTRIKLMLTDPSLNQDSSTVEQKSFSLIDDPGDEDAAAVGFPDLQIRLIGADGDTLLEADTDEITACGGMTTPTTFTETGANTGIFDKTFEFKTIAGACAFDPDEVTNAKLVADYDDETASTLLKGNNGILKSSSKTIDSGQEITITLADPDQNHDRDVKEQVEILIEPDGLSTTTELMDETDLNTGTFTKTLKVGEDFLILDDGELVDDVTITYDDVVTSNGDSEKRELVLSPPSSNAELTLIPDGKIGPGTKVTITLIDADLNEDPNSEDVIDTDILEISSDNDEIQDDNISLGDSSLQLEETENNSGEFKLTMTLIPITPEQKSGDVSIEFLASGDEIDFPAEPGDVIAISYEDENHDDDGKDVVNVLIEVTAFDPIITTDKQAYLPGDTMTVTIEDPDANRDPDVIDVIANLRAFTNSDAVGEDFDAVETGPNTGIFSVQILIVDDFESDAIRADIGDTITIEYSDEFPADYDQDDEDEKEFTETVTVGKIGENGVTENVSPSSPEVKDFSGGDIDEVNVGQQVVLSTTIANNVDADQPFVALVEVRDSDEATIFLAWQTGILDSNDDAEVGLSFMPDKPGTYSIRTFVISSLSDPQILSAVEESELTVS
jgi:hypothetical protein